MKTMSAVVITLLKVIIHLLSITTLMYLFILIEGDKLGADPVKEMIHFLGKTALNYLLLTLAITPLCKRLKQPLLVRLRRLLGLYSFTWACLHIIVFLWLELGWEVMLLISEVVQRPYLTLGMLAWIILLVLSITSIHVMKRKMKRVWFTVHRWVYVAVLLVTIHYYWSVKSGLTEPMIYFVICFFLLRERHPFFNRCLTEFSLVIKTRFNKC